MPNLLRNNPREILLCYSVKIFIFFSQISAIFNLILCA